MNPKGMVTYVLHGTSPSVNLGSASFNHCPAIENVHMLFIVIENSPSQLQLSLL
jgi:hypothetical protein